MARKPDLRATITSFIPAHLRGSKSIPAAGRLAIGTRRMQKTVAAVGVLRKEMGLSRGDATKMLSQVAQMRKGRIGPLAVPGLGRADRALRRFQAGDLAGPKRPTRTPTPTPTGPRRPTGPARPAPATGPRPRPRRTPIPGR